MHGRFFWRRLEIYICLNMKNQKKKMYGLYGTKKRMWEMNGQTGINKEMTVTGLSGTQDNTSNGSQYNSEE